jgi:hypothetical protein
MKKLVPLLGCVCMGVTACDRGAPPPSAEPRLREAPAATASAAPATSSLDPAAVEAKTGIKPEVADGVVKISYPRNDVKV